MGIFRKRKAVSEEDIGKKFGEMVVRFSDICMPVSQETFASVVAVMVHRYGKMNGFTETQMRYEIESAYSEIEKEYESQRAEA